MRRNFAAAAAIALIASVGGAAFAEAAGSGGGAALGLGQLRAMALERSTALGAALLSTDAALLQERIDSRKLLPSIDARAGGGLSYDLGGGLGSSASLSVGVGQTVYAGGKLRIQAAIDSLATARAREEARAAASAALGEVDAAYYAYLEAEASVEAAQGDLAAAQARLELAKAKSELGVISKVDLLEAEADAASRDTALSQAGKTLALARAKLASITGSAPGAVYAQVDHGPYDALAGRLAAVSDVEAETLAARLAARAGAVNPDLAAARIAAQKAGREADLAARQYWPQVSASYSHSMGYGSGPGFSAGSGSLSIFASLSIAPWGAADVKKSAEISASRARLGIEEAERGLDLELREAVYGCLAASRAIRSSSLALEFAETYYSSVLELYSLSMTSADKLSEAEALVSSGRKGLIAARYDLIGLVAGLGRSVGVEEDGLLLSLFE
jgi:outer membrane protein TolC